MYCIFREWITLYYNIVYLSTYHYKLHVCVCLQHVIRKWQFGQYNNTKMCFAIYHNAIHIYVYFFIVETILPNIK